MWPSKESRVDDAKKKRAAQFVQALPHCRALGMRAIEVTETTVSVEMPYDTKLVGDPDGRVHKFGDGFH